MVYDAGQWHGFFVMVGGDSAALTGLVFIAMTLNVEAITQDAAHSYRAIGTLTSFAAAFVIYALALNRVRARTSAACPFNGGTLIQWPRTRNPTGPPRSGVRMCPPQT